MERTITLTNISTVIDDITYPIDRAAAASEFSEVTLALADGEANLGQLVSETSSELFQSATDIEMELHNVLPRGAVGEPYQSDGDA